MTSLPYGFSTDFSKAPEGRCIIVVSKAPEIHTGIAMRTGGRLMWDWPWRGARVQHPLCWCPIPTPGDDVLKQLAEKSND